MARVHSGAECEFDTLPPDGCEPPPPLTEVVRPQAAAPLTRINAKKLSERKRLMVRMGSALSRSSDGLFGMVRGVVWRRCQTLAVLRISPVWGDALQVAGRCRGFSAGAVPAVRGNFMPPPFMMVRAVSG